MVAGPFITEVAGKLFEKERTVLGEQRADLINRNAAKGNPATGFLYGGRFFTLLPTALQRTAVKKIIHPDLREEANEFAQSFKEWEDNSHKVITAMRRWTSHFPTWQDARDLFPTMIGKLHPETAALARTRPVGFPFEDTPLIKHQFEQCCELLEYHAANRIF